MRKKFKKPGKNNTGSDGQILPTILIMSAIIALLAMTLLRLFEHEINFLVKHNYLTIKDELGAIALEHARYKLQSQNAWYQIPMKGFQYDKEYEVEGMGYYTVTIEKGNLFLTGDDDQPRQGVTEFRTVGIKVRLTRTADTHRYYAVLKKIGYGGPLISKGKIDLPCNDDAVNGEKYNFYWGDIYSGSPADDMCRIPYIPVAKGGSSPQPWMPSVYARGNIYTALGESGSGYTFGYTYTDMSPTAKSHPYSPFARVPDVELESYKQLAHENGSYFGPAKIGGSGADNPYYINDGMHDLEDLLPSSGYTLCETVITKMQTTSSVLFVDTTDALPLRMPENTSTPTNTYTGVTYVTTDTLSIYENGSEQHYTMGTLAVRGPLVLKGDDPSSSSCATADYPGSTGAGLPGRNNVCRLLPPDNYYYPQSSVNHYNLAGTVKKSMLTDFKHAGFIYAETELRIGGPRCATGSCNYEKKPVYLAEETGKNNTGNFKFFSPETLYAGPGGNPGGGGGGGGGTSESDICIYGTIYLGENSSLTIDDAGDDPRLYVYYNTEFGGFGYMGDQVVVVSWNEITYLVPTPEPEYPASF